MKTIVDCHYTEQIEINIMDRHHHHHHHHQCHYTRENNGTGTEKRMWKKVNSGGAHVWPYQCPFAMYTIGLIQLCNYIRLPHPFVGDRAVFSL